MPIYRNKETGHEVEVMRGTRLPKVYEEVSKKITVSDTKDNTGEEIEITHNTSKKSATKAKGKGNGKNKSTTATQTKTKDETPASDAATSK